MLLKSEIEQREDGWWVTIASDDVDDTGPYDTKKEAMEFQHSLRKFLLYGCEPGFMTVEDL